MAKSIIETSTGNFINTIALPDGWTGAEGEWQPEAGEEVVDIQGTSKDVWNGTSFDTHVPTIEDLTLTWKKLMADSDTGMTRTEEDIITVLNATQKSNLSTETTDRYDAKVTLRATKPV